MNVLRSIILAFSSFSVIPMPQIPWDKSNMRYLIAAFPLIGIVIGALVWLWSTVCSWLGFGPILFGAGITLVPIAVSGGIHMDGYADVVDAVSSHADTQRKREILKDPHAGAFAAIGVACYVLAYFAFATEAHVASIIAIACVPVMSRCLSGFAVVAFKGAAEQGMYAAEHSSAHKGVVLALLAAVYTGAAALAIWQGGVQGVIAVCVGVTCLAFLKPFARMQFGGMNGDVSGFFLQIAELAMLMSIVITARLVG